MGESRTGVPAAMAMRICRSFAAVAQLVEHFTRNEGVSGSNPLGGSDEPPHRSGPPERALAVGDKPSTETLIQ
jgi:hypothetical protein